MATPPPSLGSVPEGKLGWTIADLYRAARWACATALAVGFALGIGVAWAIG